MTRKCDKLFIPDTELHQKEISSSSNFLNLEVFRITAIFECLNRDMNILLSKLLHMICIQCDMSPCGNYYICSKIQFTLY